MQFRYIEIDADGRGFTGTTFGCGCCSQTVLMGLRDIQAHIHNLKRNSRKLSRLR